MNNMAPNRRITSNNTLNQSGSLKRMNRRRALALLVSVLALGLIGWMYLSQASKAAELERNIRNLRQQKEEYQRQNDHLTYQVAQTAAIEQLEQRARELGYVTVWQVRFLPVAGYPAQDEFEPDGVTILTQHEPAERATPSAVAGWWQSVTRQFETWSQTDQP